MIMDILSQSLSDRLDLCGIEINDDETIANRFLLSLAKRRLQMCEAFIADANANSIIFKRSFNGDPLACLISSDLSIDERVKPIIATMLHGAIRRYIGITLSLSNGRRGTLMLLSGEFSMISNKDIMIIQEIAAMIEDRHKIREEDEASAAKSMIVNTSILFTALQVYLSVATNISKKIQSCLQEEKCRGSPKFFNLPNARSFLTAQPTPRFTTTQHRLDHYCKRLQVVVENINTATDRLSTVARRYSEPDTKKYYLSCFQYRSEGFVDQVNEMLLEVSKLIPDHHLSWTFHLDAEVVDNSSGHRTFYQHLFFFLEGILLRWSDCCSSAHVSVSFDCEHSFHSSVDSQNRLELGYLMVRFQPEHVSQNSEEVKVAKSRSRQLVEMLGDFLRLTDHGACVEVLQAEKASGAGRGVCEGEGESVEAESYLIRLPCHFHLVLDSHLGRSNSRVLYPSALGCSSVDSHSVSHREVEVSKDEWLDDETSSNAPTESLVYSRSQFLKSKAFCRSFSVQRDIATRKRSVVCEDGMTAFTVSSIPGLRSSLIIHHVSSTKESGLQHAPRTPRFAQRGRSISPVGKGSKATGNEGDDHSVIEEEPSHQMEWMKQIVDISRSFMHKLMNRSSFIFSSPSLDRSDSSGSPRHWRPKIAPINTKSSFSAATTGRTASP